MVQAFTPCANVAHSWSVSMSNLRPAAHRALVDLYFHALSEAVSEVHTPRRAKSWNPKNKSSPRHTKTTIFSVTLDRSMRIFNGTANEVLRFSGLTFSSAETTSPMTVTEKVKALFEQLRLPVFRYLRRRTRDPGKAEDLTQETFLRLFQHLSENRPLDNPKAWLFTVANNLSVDVSRKESHFKDLDETTWNDIEASRAAHHANPEEFALQRERIDRLHMAVLNLTQLQRECLHLRAEGLRYREIASLLELSMSTVMDAVRRATMRVSLEFESKDSA